MEYVAEWGTPYASKDNAVRSWSREDFFTRVKTYKISTWLDKPLCLSPLECARYGWINCSKDMLECIHCKSRIMFRPHQDLEKATVNKLALEFVTRMTGEGHKAACPWRVDPSLPFGDLVLDPPTLIDSYQKRVEQFRENLSKYPVIAHPFIIDLTEKLQAEDGIKLLQRANVTELTTRNVVSCILAMCGWIWKQSTPSSTTPSSPSPSPSPVSPPPLTPQSPSSAISSSSSSSSSSSHNEYIYCSFCQRDIGLWNHIYHEDVNGIDDDYTIFFKGQQLEQKRAVRVDYQGFGKSWDKPVNAFQNIGWEWGSTIAKIGQQENFKTIQKEPFHPVQAHRWFCPYLLTREGVEGWERVATVLQEATGPTMEEQALDVINILHHLTHTPPTKRRRVEPNI